MRGHNFRSDQVWELLTKTFVEFYHLHFDTSVSSIHHKSYTFSTDLGKMTQTEKVANYKHHVNGNDKASSLHLAVIDPIDPFRLARVIQPY